MPGLPSPEVAHLILQAVRLQQVHLGEASGRQVLDLLEVPVSPPTGYIHSPTYVLGRVFLSL